ncbi:MAG: CdaR family protein [Lentisphaeria bacterium]|nr:CdaR family protein [Lentisphaeria bacterium]
MNFNSVPAIIRVDFGRKFLALFLAVVIWYTVRFEILVTKSFEDVPVRLVYDNSEIFVEETPTVVTLTFRGAKSRLESIEPGNLEVTIRINDVDEGVYDYSTSISGRKHVTLPRGTRLLSAKPRQVTFGVDRIITKEVVVVPQTSGKLAPNYQMLTQESIPSTVRVRGPSRDVNRMETIKTAPVPLDRTLTDSFQKKNVALEVAPRVTASPSRVSLRFEIAKDDSSRKFEDLPVRVLNALTPVVKPQDGLPPVTVILRGPQNHLSALDKAHVHPFVDISSIQKPGVYDLKVGVYTDSAVKFTTEALSPPSLEKVSLVPVAAPPEAAE